MSDANRGFVLSFFVALTALSPRADQRAIAAESAVAPFQAENLVAWCIVPFDAKHRTPQQRVAMLKAIGFKKYAYDWRAEHLPTFGDELALLKEHGIELTGLWFPTAMNDDARLLLAALKTHGVKTQLWVTGGGSSTTSAAEQKQRVAEEVQRLRPIATAAAEIDCQVALYNHGGWFGEPENQLQIIAALNLPNVGIVYNQHHGHDHVDRFSALLKQMQPHLLALNLNGMLPKGDQLGQKILPLGAGTLDLALLKTIANSGYRGPIGILGHTQDDAEERLRDNLDGLAWLLPQLAGRPAGPPPKYRTYQAPPQPGEARLVPGKFGHALDATAGGVLVNGQPTYREPPLTLELWAKLANRGPYHILAANELKSSPTHWELFSMAGNGRLTVYVPGCQPDHIRSERDVCDDQWHHLAMIFELTRIRLFVDAQLVADQPITRTGRPAGSGGFALGQLVDRAIGCQGLIDEVRLSRGVREITSVPTKPQERDAQTIELWRFDSPGELPKVSDAKPPRPAPNHWGKQIIGFDWTEQDSVDGRWQQTDFGPFLASTIPLPKLPAVRKGLSIRVGEGDEATVCFDTENLSWRAMWLDGFLTINPARYGLIASPTAAGRIVFAVGESPGWRLDATQPTPLRFHALTQHGRRIGLTYDVGPIRIREQPAFVRIGEQPVFRRPLRIHGPHSGLTMVCGKLPGSPRIEQHDGAEFFILEQDGQLLAAALHGTPSARWQLAPDGTVSVNIAANTGATVFEVRWGAASSTQRGTMFAALRQPLNAVDLSVEPTPGSTLWPETLVTHGTRAEDHAAYVVDTLTLPTENPYRALFFISGHDFFENGDLALCTVHGDVWRVSGVDETLDRLTWRRYATGLFQPLGLKIVDNQVYVLGRDQITRLKDLNGDHAADVYENFCNLYETSAGGHDYVTCLERDSIGAWYFLHAKTGVMRVSPDGRNVAAVATGLRNPNGMGIGPSDFITAAPQEGEWTPASAVYHVRDGNHFGYTGPQVTPNRPLGYDPPICWIPRRQDNSCGGQCWVNQEHWGPFSRQMLHLSFGQCRLLPILLEEVDHHWQGAACELPLEFASGVTRGRENPHDGQLYVSGLKGWVTSAVQDGCLQRVRYTGRPALVPTGIKSYTNGLALSFSADLDTATVEDPEAYRVQRWDYRYSGGYGSAEYRDVAKGIVGREDLDVLSASVIDRRTLFLELADFRPAMQYAVTGRVRSRDGLETPLAVYPTLHRLGRETVGESQLVRKPRRGVLEANLRQRLQPGLAWTVVQNDRRDVRQLRMPAWRVDEGQSPTSRLPPKPWTSVVTGYLQIPERDAYTFRGEGAGLRTVEIDGRRVWPVNAVAQGSATATPTDGSTVLLGRGFYSLRIEADSDKDGASAARLLWQGESFAEEPVPPTAVWHDPQTDGFTAAQQWRHGRALFVDLRCGRCHTAEEARTGPAGPDLSAVTSRLHPAYVYQRVLSPYSLRPDSQMPRLLADIAAGRQTAADLTAFLLGKNGNSRGANDNRAAPTRAAVALYEDLGCIACHRFTPPSEADPYGRVSLFFTSAKLPAPVLTEYLQAPARHFPATRMPTFSLTVDEANDLSAVIASTSTEKLFLPAEWEQADAARGERAFAQFRCVACHAGPGRFASAALPAVGLPPKTPLQQFARGCLGSEQVSDRSLSPRFSLSADDRSALQAYCSSPNRSAANEPPGEQLERLLTSLRCQACHHRDQLISPRGELLVEESDRGIPPEALPSLTWAGEKLHEAWLASFLAGRTNTKLRPWLKARMPAFPFHAARVAEELVASHGMTRQALSAETDAIDAETVETGRRLTLTQGGLDCRQCHAVGGQLAAGDASTQLARGIDFELVRDRVRHDYYQRFVLDPPRFDLATRMPKFSPDGRTTKVITVFDGDAERQFAAIWAYIQSLPAPPAQRE